MRQKCNHENLSKVTATLQTKAKNFTSIFKGLIKILET